MEKFATVGLLSPVGCWLINARRCRVEVISRDPWQVFCQAPRATVQLPLAAVCSTTAAAADSLSCNPNKFGSLHARQHGLHLTSAAATPTYWQVPRCRRYSCCCAPCIVAAPAVCAASCAQPATAPWHAEIGAHTHPAPRRVTWAACSGGYAQSRPYPGTRAASVRAALHGEPLPVAILLLEWIWRRCKRPLLKAQIKTMNARCVTEGWLASPVTQSPVPMAVGQCCHQWASVGLCSIQARTADAARTRPRARLRGSTGYQARGSRL